LSFVAAERCAACDDLQLVRIGATALAVRFDDQQVHVVRRGNVAFSLALGFGDLVAHW
jgi:hypothetical protein